MEKAITKTSWSTAKTILYYGALLLRTVAFFSFIIYMVNLAHTGYSSIKLFLFMGNNQAPIPRKLGFSSISDFSSFLDKVSIILIVVVLVIIGGAIAKDVMNHIQFKKGDFTRRSILKLRDLASSFFIFSIIGFYSVVGLVFYAASYYIQSTIYAEGTGYQSVFNINSIITLLLLFFVFVFTHLLLNLVVEKLFIPFLATYAGPSETTADFDRMFVVKSKVPTNTRDDERKHPSGKFTSEDTLKGIGKVKYYLYTIKPKFVFPYLFVEAPGVSKLSKYKTKVVYSEEALALDKDKKAEEKDYSNVGEIIPKRPPKTFTDRPVLRPAKKKKVKSKETSSKSGKEVE